MSLISIISPWPISLDPDARPLSGLTLAAPSRSPAFPCFHLIQGEQHYRSFHLVLWYRIGSFSADSGIPRSISMTQRRNA